MATTLTSTHRLGIFFLGLLFILGASLLPSPEPIVTADGKTIALTLQGKLCMGILAMVILYWVTEIMPFAVSGFLGIVLIHLLGVQDFRSVLASGFGHPITCFVIGILFFSLGVTKSGLGERLTRLILRRVGQSSRVILLAFMTTGAMLSMWMSDAAVAAILMPIAVGMLRSEEVEPLKSNFGRALMIACVWGPSIGGIATPAGAAPNPISLSFLREMAGVERTFVDWMILGVPSAAVLLPISWLILIRVFPPEMEKLTRLHASMQNDVPRKLSRAEWTTMAVFLLTVTLWIATPLIRAQTGIVLSMEYVIFATVIIFFIPKLDVLSWNDIHRDFSWGAMLLVMTGISIGFVVAHTGVAEWFSYMLLHRIGELPLYVVIVGTALAVTLLHNFLSSNTVTAVVMVPIVIYSSVLMGLPPWLAVAPAAFCSTMGLILVTTAPTNLIPFTAGYFSIRDFAKAGVFISIIGSVVIGTVIYLMHVVFGIQ